MAAGYAARAAAVTLSDATVLSPAPEAFFVGVGGDVVVVPAGNSSTVTLKNVPSGSVVPIACKQFYSTGTTATNLVALYES